MVEKTAASTAISLAVVMEWNNWMAAQWMALDDEKRAEMMDEKDDMMALFNF